MNKSRLSDEDAEELDDDFEDSGELQFDQEVRFEDGWQVDDRDDYENTRPEGFYEVLERELVEEESDTSYIDDLNEEFNEEDI